MEIISACTYAYEYVASRVCTRKFLNDFRAFALHTQNFVSQVANELLPFASSFSLFVLVLLLLLLLLSLWWMWKMFKIWDIHLVAEILPKSAS